MKNDKTPTEAKQAEAAPAAPTLSAESKGSDKAQIICALAQPGKPLNAFWSNPTQENLQAGTVQLVLEQNTKGKSPIEIESLLRVIGSANASALKQFMEKNLSLPSGAKASAVPASLAKMLADL